MKKIVYIAGDMLKKGSILLREQEAKDIREIGHTVYSPIEDKSINDKKNQSKHSNDNLAERIVRNDTKGILQSDIIVIEPQDNALGTMVELGQIKGYKDSSRMIQNLISEIVEDKSIDFEETICRLERLASMLDKEVYPHYEDIRRTDIPEQGDRRSWGVNQYVYGVCLDLTEGKGFYDWQEILKKLNDDK